MDEYKAEKFRPECQKQIWLHNTANSTCIQLKRLKSWQIAPNAVTAQNADNWDVCPYPPEIAL